MANYDEQKELLDNTELEEQAVVEASRATLVWDEDSGLASNTEEQPSEQPSEAEPPSEELDLSILDVSQTQPEEEVVPDKAYEKFAADFEKYLGTPLKDAQNLVKELQQFKAQQVIDKQRSELMNAWGVSGSEFDQRLQAVQERFKLYSPELQQKLDNPQGAQLIWAKLQQEAQAQQKNVPSLDKGKRTQAGAEPSYMFTQAQILKMSNEEYSKNAKRIEYAYTNGLVKR